MDWKSGIWWITNYRGCFWTFWNLKIQKKFENENEIIKVIIIIFKYYLINKTN
jgi:hypothetical protein